MARSSTNQWLKRQVLGKGSYGTVFLASPINSNKINIAVKSSGINQSSSLIKEEKFLYELRNCPQIISCYGSDVSIENGKCWFNLLLEYAPDGTLSDLIKNEKKSIYGSLPECLVGWYTYLILLGLKYIHNKGYVHCDLKPENILVFPSQYGTQKRLKIADFGLAKKAGSNTVKPTTLNGFWYFHRGTPIYSSPESILHGIHESAMDIWSLGCIVLEMLTGNTAYPISEDVLSRIGFDQELPQLLPHDEENISDYGKDFLRKCFTINPKTRWSADQLLDHPFIVEHVYQLQSLGIVPVDPKTIEENVGGPTSWCSSNSLFIDQITDACNSACISSPALPLFLPPRNYREALLKGLK